MKSVRSIITTLLGLFLVLNQQMIASTTDTTDHPPQLLQHPTLSATQIVFVYAGDLWSVSRQGGVAQRLTSMNGKGVASLPSFSPDGSEIAFTASFNGNADVYVISVNGGTPRRLTYHPAEDRVIGWTLDGKNVLFSSVRDMHGYQLLTIPREGGFQTALPFPSAVEGSYSPDGAYLAYVPIEHAFEIWKRYRGGRTSPIWVARLSDSSVTSIPRDNSNDFSPMWIGDHIFFLSDRNGPVSLLSYDTKAKKVSIALKNDGFDFKYASSGPNGIVIEQFGAIWLYDLKSSSASKLDIRVPGPFPETQPRDVSVASQIKNADISPDGSMAAFDARGEIFTVSADKSEVRNITNTPGTDERYPAWSPDGTKLAYFSDESGEYALFIKNRDGQGEPEKIELGTPPSYFLLPTWSPDGKKIAYVDKRLNLWYADIDKGTIKKVFQDQFTDPQEISQAAWSPDSQWLAYTRQEISHMRAVFLYSLVTGESTRITDGMSDAFSPVFDRNGKYLYLLASTDVGPTLDNSMLSLDRSETSSVYVVLLQQGLSSPMPPESAVKVPDPHENKADASEAEGGTATASVKIDLEGMDRRTLALPIPAKTYSSIIPGKEGVVFLLENAKTVYRFDLKARKTDKLLDNVQSMHVSANGEQLLYRQLGGQQPTWVVVPIPPPGSEIAGGKTLDFSSMQVHTEPMTEWKEMYHEAFRDERDFFYASNFHGADLAALEKKYAPYLPGLASRDGLSYILEDAMGELTVSHMFKDEFFQDTPTAPNSIPVGLLAADFKTEDGRYRFTRIYDGENWNPQLHAPLTQPGNTVAEGEYLLAVNEREVHANDDVYSFFQETSGKSVVLRVGPNPDGTGSRSVTVVPVKSDYLYRLAAWVENNRREVDRLSHGQLAYIYLPDTDRDGYTYFNRYFFAQAGKRGAVIDARFNGGGTIPDYPIIYLQQTLMNYRTTRDGEDQTVPVSLIQGPKAMMINEITMSGGDALAWYFRREKMGVLIGTRTWGGVTGYYGPLVSLMDGVFMPTPTRGLWTPNNKWELENQGVAPDVHVELDPKAVREGHDPQLEKTVAILMEELKKNPIPTHQRPPYPNYHQGNVSAHPDH